MEAAKERLSRQELRLANAKDIVKHNGKRAKKLIEGYDEWRTFQVQSIRCIRYMLGGCSLNVR